MQKKLLVADDDASLRNIVARVFEGTEWEVIAASDGASALEALAKNKPDLILLDLNMPGISGREVLKKVRLQPELSLTPVIILSGVDDTAEKVEGFNQGADDYITKPFSILELVSRIENVLKRNRRILNANPLTQLPGAPSIEEEATARMRGDEPLAFLYLDLDNFKAYNDCYGYLNGDKALKRLAGLLLDLSVEFKQEQVFVGHIGGDDFAVILHPGREQELAAEIARRFDLLAPELYNAEDRRRGHILSKNRAGHAMNYPLMTLSIAIATNENRKITHYAKIVDIATEIKSHLKSQKDRTSSVYLKDRRKD